MRTLSTLAFSLAILPGALAAPAEAPVRAEIGALLERLTASSCQFQRNGTWYSAGRAKAHLLRKLDYIERHGTLESTEQFIDLAGASSSSGQPYQVRCADGISTDGRQWLRGQLKAMRAGGMAGDH